MRTWLRVALGLSLGLPLVLLTLAPAGAQTPLTTLPSAGPQTPASPHMEIIHHPNYDKTVFMPFVPGITPYAHKPTSTNIAVLELGEPEQLIEIQMIHRDSAG
jgi:hypothetical protein